MKKFIAAAALLLSAQWSYADIIVDNAYVPQVPPGSMAYAAYLSITNSGAEARTVVGISSPVFGMTHLHHTMMKDGVSSMKSMDKLVIEPGNTVTLQPGGMHIMLMKPAEDVMAAGMVPIKLEFKDGEIIEFNVSIRTLN